MLSKNNKILIGCLALLLVMSVGYALFSDTITINGSATAKGDFTLTTTCDEVEPSNVSNKGSVTESTITCNNNIVNASATLDYPGTSKWFRVKVKNEGTIAAKLKEVVDLNNTDVVYFRRGEGMDYGSEKCEGNNTNQVCVYVYPGDTLYMDFEDAEEIGYDVDWNQFDVDFQDPTLDPGETAYFYIDMQWLGSSTTPGEELTAAINAKFTWEQVTE